MKKQNNLMEWLNQVVGEPYYFFHFLALFSYFIVRSSAANFLSPQITQHLFHREIQAILAFLMLAAHKMVREETWEGFIADTLFFGMIFLIALSLLMDYHLTLWYIVVFSGRIPCIVFIWLHTCQSVFSLAVNHMLEHLSFGIVDLGLFPNAAEKFGISPGGSIGQLPTYILFENNTEVSRFPEFNFEATPTPPITTVMYMLSVIYT